MEFPNDRGANLTSRRARQPVVVETATDPSISGDAAPAAAVLITSTFPAPGESAAPNSANSYETSHSESATSTRC